MKNQKIYHGRLLQAWRVGFSYRIDSGCATFTFFYWNERANNRLIAWCNQFEKRWTSWFVNI